MTLIVKYKVPVSPQKYTFSLFAKFLLTTDPPDVSCQPVYVVLVNTSLKITCNADSFPSASFVIWTKSSSNNVIYNGTEKYLDFPRISVADGGIYICTATNLMLDYNNKTRLGTGSCRINVTVVCTYKASEDDLMK